MNPQDVAMFIQGINTVIECGGGYNAKNAKSSSLGRWKMRVQLPSGAPIFLQDRKEVIILMVDTQLRLREMHQALSAASAPLALASVPLAESAVPMSRVAGKTDVFEVSPQALSVAPASMVLATSSAPIAAIAAPLAKSIPML